jgi:hypothetical protein
VTNAIITVEGILGTSCRRPHALEFPGAGKMNKRKRYVIGAISVLAEIAVILGCRTLAVEW